MVIGWQTVVMSKTQYNVNNLRISFEVKDNLNQMGSKRKVIISLFF